MWIYAFISLLDCHYSSCQQNIFFFCNWILVCESKSEKLAFSVTFNLFNVFRSAPMLQSINVHEFMALKWFPLLVDFLFLFLKFRCFFHLPAIQFSYVYDTYRVARYIVYCFFFFRSQFRFEFILCQFMIYIPLMRFLSDRNAEQEQSCAKQAKCCCFLFLMQFKNNIFKLNKMIHSRLKGLRASQE